MIKTQHIYKSYGKKLILEDINLELPKGKVTSLIGSNGAGKTTLLSVISRLIPQDEGEVYIDEKEVQAYKNRELAQKLSILKQSNHIRLRLTVRELVSFGRFPYSQDKLTPEDEAKIDEALRFMDMQKMEKQYIDELSGGQRQRAFMAMVVAQDTEYVLLDEPLNNLDMKHSQQTMRTLRRLADEYGKTIIIVLHDINFASYYSDYIVALKDGRVKYFDETHKIINEAVLQDIYDLDITVTEYNKRKVCHYYG